MCRSAVERVDDILVVDRIDVAFVGDVPQAGRRTQRADSRRNRRVN
jgi:hypothetical protein